MKVPTQRWRNRVQLLHLVVTHGASMKVPTQRWRNLPSQEEGLTHCVASMKVPTQRWRNAELHGDSEQGTGRLNESPHPKVEKLPNITTHAQAVNASMKVPT